jgi:tRNA uridine 5-carboxymethylaminomethyl modification enzyme
LTETLETTYLNPDSDVRRIFTASRIAVPKNRFSLADILKRPDVPMDLIRELAPGCDCDPLTATEVATRLKYQGYLAKEQEQVQRLLNLENRKLPADLDFDQVANLAREAREQLAKFRPATLGQASRLSGINPADLTALLFYLENNARGRA